MPGVPSGRGCEGCRKQKKKCDQAFPSCSRCTRLGIRCVGAGQQRFKFLEPKSYGQNQKNEHTVTIQVKSRSPGRAQVPSVPDSPKNALSVLRYAFIELVQPSTDIRFNLKWTYGCFLEHVPQRLGLNEALDAAATATISAHSDYCSGRGATFNTLGKYTNALAMLRMCLDDPVKARAPETLCAVMLLIICQSCMNLVEGIWTGHCEGIARILKARGCYNPHDDFETKLLLTMRGPVVFEALYNSKIQFTPREWKAISNNPLDKDSYEGKLMNCLATIPYFIESWTQTPNPDQSSTLASMLEEIRSSYDTIKSIIDSLQLRIIEIETKTNTTETTDLPKTFPKRTHWYFQRTYALTLTFAIVLNCVLGGAYKHSDPTYHSVLSSESASYARSLLDISRKAKSYRPMGASYVTGILSIAWMGAMDASTKTQIEEVWTEYQIPPPLGRSRDRHGLAKAISGLRWAEQRLRLEAPEVDIAMLEGVGMEYTG